MDKKYMVLWLEAPLQAWGSESKFGRRDTQKFPTKSGLYGLYLSAMGAQGPQVELLETLADFKQTVISYNPVKRKSSTSEEAPERESPQPLLMDFHMIGSGYDDGDPWQTNLIPKKLDGGKAVGGGTKMTYRYYLQDAHFAVIQEIDKGMGMTIAKALQDPVYDLFFGRKHCISTDFIFRGVFDTYELAWKACAEIANQKGLIADFLVTEDQSDGEKLVINDVPVQFGDVKRYRDRTVTLVQL